MKRAYSLLELKAVDDEKRILEGIATTPSPDRMNDVIELDGISMSLPIPFLYQHNSKQPIGTVVSKRIVNNQMVVKVQMAAAGVATFIDEAWSLIKNGLIRGLSIGFRPIEESYMNDTGGYRYTKSEIYEISAVTIPANADCNILTVKSADSQALAALGEKRAVVRLDKTANPPGASGPTTKKGPMTIKDQIVQFEAKRAAADARMSELLKKSADEARTFDDAETEEYDGLETEVKAIDQHLVRLKAQEKRLVDTAKEVTKENTANAEKAAATRGGHSITVKSNLPKGIGMARLAIAMVRSRGNPYQAMEIAKQQWGADQPEIAQHIKSVVEAGDTTTSGWASQLLPPAQQMSNDFLDLLRPMLIMGKLPLKNVPFNCQVPLQSAGGTYGYVGEGAPKPVTKPTYGSATLRFEKAAGIIVITQELARFGNPSAEMLVRDEMLKGLANFFDTVFISATAAVSNVSPAGILNGKSTTGAASGTTAARFRYDANLMIQAMVTNNQNLATAYILMGAGIAMSLSSMINSLGQPEFPTISAQGGTYLGIPIVVSTNLGTNIILVQPGDILLAEDPAITIDVSTEASVEMDTAPALGDSSPITDVSTLKSFWQNNLVGIRAEQFRTWKVGRSSAVEFISGAAYTPPTS